MTDLSAKSIKQKIQDLVSSGNMSRAGVARAAGLHANTLRDCGEESWNPTSETLDKLAAFLRDNDDRPVLATIEEIIDEARNGRMFVLVDDEDRENEGDLVIPAQMATPAAINFMATHGKGLICLSLDRKRVERLGLEPMSRNNRESMQTAFTVSIEAREGVTTGISAADRARTISVAIDAGKGPEDIVSPGHVFPLVARDGGVLVRAGHTEAAVDISRLAGLNPSGVICEIMNEDGTMARMDDLIAFARRHDLKIGTIRDLIAYRLRHDHLVEQVSESTLHSDYGGEWRAMTYRSKVSGATHVVLQKGHVDPEQPTLVRMHAISIFDDVLGQSGARKRQLQRSMAAIGERGAGLIVVIMPDRPEMLQAEIGRHPHPDGELRDYGIGAQILVDRGVSEMVLLSDSERTVVGLEGYGLRVVGREPIPD
ncbi:3,4-dihydroxy-2-butanone-4-phosphate synthase [Pelagerythrobacter marensis]|uniref:3,4-dihydroxy-2-butanone 4-phosphate synthase n=1 Tax=Pelagerythrobacter marensis TaxID=543877 RepID=A0ABZ2CZL9_9SPHN